MIHLAILAMLSLVPPVEAETCTASWYSSREGSGSATASGRKLNDGELTAAHKTLPFGSRVKVRNRANGRTVTVTITDRGPFLKGRCIDLTPAARDALGMGGTATVDVE